MIGGFPQQEQETRKVSTTGRWEDIWRPLLQGIGIWLISIWQIVVSLAALTSWAYAWSQSKTWEGPRSADVGLLLGAAVVLISPFVFGVIVSHGRVQWLIGRMGNYDEISLSPGFNLTIVIMCAVMFNILFNRTVVYVLLTTQIVPVMATIIALTSWPSGQTLKQSWRLELLIQAAQNSDKWHIARENNRHAKEMAELQHEWDAERGVDVLAIENQLSVAQQTAAELEKEVEKLRNAPPSLQLAAYNHGGARVIGNREFNSLEVEAMIKYLTGWSVRGTGYNEWCTRKGRAPFGGDGISDPTWRKITDCFKELNYLDARNNALVEPDFILTQWKLTPLSEVVTEPEGVNPLEKPNQTKPNQEILQSAIDKIPQRRTA